MGVENLGYVLRWGSIMVMSYLDFFLLERKKMEHKVTRETATLNTLF